MKKIKKISLLAAILGLTVLLVCVLTSCAEQKITVQLYDGDTALSEVEIVQDKEYNLGVPQKKGYAFLGWYSEAEGGTAYTDAEGNSAGMTWKNGQTPVAYAHWEAQKYTIRLNYCGATSAAVITDFTVIYDKEIASSLPVPTKEGCVFAGWSTDEMDFNKQVTDATGAFVDNANIFNSAVYPVSDASTEVVLYAQWKTKSVTFIFSTEDGTAVSEKTYPVGTVLQEMPLSTKDNYCFVSWCFDATLLTEMTLPYTIPVNSDEYVTLYAKFLPGSIDVLQFNTIPSTGDREYEVSYEGDAEMLVIPDLYYGKKVTCVRRIDSGTVREIVLPQSVKEFIVGAFYECESLEKINIPWAVESIPDRCFCCCTRLTDINIPSKVNMIGKMAFAGCSSITSIHLPKCIETIGAGAFGATLQLASISIDEGCERYLVKDSVLYCKTGTSLYLVQYPAAKEGSTYQIDPATVKILDYAFAGSHISSIVIGGKISAIEQVAFGYCEELVSVSISSDVVFFSIGKEAFVGCSRLKAMKLELDKVPTLDITALAGVPKTFSVYVTSNMIRNYQTATGWREISEHIYSLGAIYGDFAVEEVDGIYCIRQYFGTEKAVAIPEILNARRIEGIYPGAFACSAIEEVTIPQYVTIIGYDAFSNCESLKKVIMTGEPPLLGEDVFSGVGKDFAIYIKNTTDVLDAYRVHEDWKDFSQNIWSYQ